MAQNFAGLDWLIIGLYLVFLAGIGYYFSKRQTKNSKEYFLAGRTLPFWVVAISILATSQSAATFLGGPDQGYRGDFTYLSTNIGTILGALFVAKWLIPRFYSENITTVYELLERRYNAQTMRAAGGMYLIGRVFASGSRLFLAAIAVSMILFSNIEPGSMIISAFLMVAAGLLITFLGGIKSVIWSDFFQFLIYVTAALSVLWILRASIPVDTGALIEGLRDTPEGTNKLTLFDWRLDFSAPFSMLSIVTGLTLLAIASFGMDQDMSQRMLTCRTPGEGAKALIISSIIAIPVIWIFITIGELLYVIYDRPDLMAGQMGAQNTGEFQGEKITIFMSYILNELPAGLKGLVTVGVIAAAISTINSGLNSMSSVIVEDFYKPWRAARGDVSDMHYVRAGQMAMAIVGLLLFGMAVLCYYWQQYADTPLLEFALSVMIFSYSGLLGVYFTVLFTERGAPWSVMLALAAGFVVTLAQQDYIIDVLGLPQSWKGLAFTWKLCIGTAIAFIVCQLGNSAMPESRKAPS